MRIAFPKIFYQSAPARQRSTPARRPHYVTAADNPEPVTREGAAWLLRMYRSKRDQYRLLRLTPGLYWVIEISTDNIAARIFTR